MNHRHRNHLVRAFVGLGIAALGIPVEAASSDGSFQAARSALEGACQAFAGFDRDQDGTAEIRTLKRLGPDFESAGKGKGTVLVLVESRLLVRRQACPDLAPSLKTLAKDIGRDGEHAFVVETSFYDGPDHQDGLTIVAYRDFLRRLWRDVKDFKGVVLVGNFPQAFLVRQYAWLRDDPITLYAGTKAEVSFKQPWIRDIAEPVVSPADIVLADLDGRWDRIYVKQPTNVGELMAVFPKGSDVTENWEKPSERYEDFFDVNDGSWREEERGGHKMRFVFAPEANEECSAADHARPNVIARPGISVSRINAYHAGVVPDPTVHGIHGEGLLDAQGHPQTIELKTPRDVPNLMNLWVPSEALERKLLVEYFDRNHAYRTGRFDNVTSPSGVSTDLGDDIGELRASVAGWKNLNTKEFLDGRITLTDLVKWMKRPALVREIRAHSNPVLSGFENPPDLDAMQKELGPQPWYWTRQGNKLVPSLRGVGGCMGFGLLRTMYENKSLPPNPVLYFHTGCESMRPIGAEDMPFNAPDFGKWQLDECTLFYANGLALIGRSKVFYDEPRGFWRVLGKGGTYGEAWQAYFDVESRDPQVAKDGIGRKRSYFWSLVGDFTLRLPAKLVAGK